MNDRRRDIWDEMHKTVLSGFTTQGYVPEEARRAADTVIDALWSTFAGQRVGYLPKKRQAQREQMVEAAHRRSVRQASEEYGVARETVYREIRRRMRLIR